MREADIPNQTYAKKKGEIEGIWRLYVWFHFYQKDEDFYFLVLVWRREDKSESEESILTSRIRKNIKSGGIIFDFTCVYVTLKAHLSWFHLCLPHTYFPNLLSNTYFCFRFFFLNDTSFFLYCGMWEASTWAAPLDWIILHINSCEVVNLRSFFNYKSNGGQLDGRPRWLINIMKMDPYAIRPLLIILWRLIYEKFIYIHQFRPWKLWALTGIE